MDYQALSQLIPRPVYEWQSQEIFTWLKFIHLDNLHHLFASSFSNGKKLLAIKDADFEKLNISNTIIKRKLHKWISEGLRQFDDYLSKMNPIANKENMPPALNRLQTSHMRQPVKEKERPAHRKSIFSSYHSKQQLSKKRMIVKHYEGSQAAFYIVSQQQKSAKIGRSNSNIIRSLEASIEGEHAEIVYTPSNGKFYLRDFGTQSGSFIKITHRHTLELNGLIEMGQFLIKVTHINKQEKIIWLNLFHMVSKQYAEIQIELKQKNKSFTFGRRKNCEFAFDDEHLSGNHAKIYFSRGQFVIQDLGSTNGTWQRLSDSRHLSQPIQLADGTIFKIGTTITYICEIECSKKSQVEKMDIQYSPFCDQCTQKQKNIVLIPCNHNILCEECSKALSHCPSCKLPIEDRIKIFI